MSLGADVLAALPELRARAESLHTDTFTVYRPTGETTTDPDTFEEKPVFATVLTGVKGKFQATASQNIDSQTPGVKVAETNFQWHTSIDTVGVLTDDEVECTDAPHDPSQVGVRVRVTGPFIKSMATARRFNVEELT